MVGAPLVRALLVFEERKGADEGCIESKSCQHPTCVDILYYHGR